MTEIDIFYKCPKITYVYGVMVFVMGTKEEVRGRESVKSGWIDGSTEHQT